MPSGCVPLDAAIAVRGDADIVQCHSETREECRTSLHTLDDTSQSGKGRPISSEKECVKNGETTKGSHSETAWRVHCSLTRLLGRTDESPVGSLGSKHLQTPERPFYNDIGTDEPLIVH